MFDLNISKNFDLIITNKNPTTAFTPLLEEWLYLKRLIERAEIHFNKNEMYEEIFSYELYVGMDDEAIEDIVIEKLYSFYERMVENVRDILLVEVFKTKTSFFVFYKHVDSNTTLIDDDVPYKIYF